MADNLDIFNEMAKFDNKDREFFDQLSEEEQKKFSPFLMIRWGSCVEGNADLQAYYLMSTNERLNKNYFDISGTHHKKFQWLMATTVSPGMGRMRHSWIKQKKRETANVKAEKLLRELYPNRKDRDIELLAEINDKATLKQLARDHGWDDKRIKEYL